MKKMIFFGLIILVFSCEKETNDEIKIVDFNTIKVSEINESDSNIYK
jgi:hypothetical protein